MKKILIHNEDLGGNFISISGSPGSCKTAVTLTFMNYIVKHHPTERIFFSESYQAPLQCFKNSNGKRLPYQIWIQEDSNVVIRNRDTGKEKDIGQKYFKDFQDLWDKTEGGVVNVPFFGDRGLWRDFLAWLRGPPEWVHVFIEEMQEICPLRMSMMKEMEKFIDVAKDFRKCHMNVAFNTQTVVEIAWQLVRKIQIHIYLPGARPTSNSRVKQYAIDGLEKSPEKGNEAYIEYLGTFGKTRFTKIWKPTKGCNYEAYQR